MKQLMAFYRNPWIWGTHLFGVVIALGAPDDVLRSSPLLTKYVEIMGVIFPPVVGYRQTSSFPEVSALYFAVMLPLGIVWLWKGVTNLSGTMLNLEARIWRTARWVRLALVVGFGFFFLGGLFYVMVRLNPGYDFHILGITRSRFSLAVWGAFFTLGPWQLLSTYVASVRRTLSRSQQSEDIDMSSN